MKKIELSQEDFEFLQELSHELNTQTTDGNAQPVYWGVMETEEVGAPEGCGDPIIYMGDGETMELEEAVKYVEEEYLKDLDEANQEEWADIDKNDMDDVVRFMNENLDWHNVRIVWYKKQERISNDTGAFLTKRACKEYIEKFHYNHCHPHTYAMTAYRNFELERLLKILKGIDFEEKPTANVIASHWEWGTSVHIIASDGMALGKLTIEDKDTDEGYIFDVNTHASVRQRGYASMILDKAEEEAKQRGVKRLYLWVERGSWMEAWYRRRGFEDEEFMKAPSDNTLWLVKFLKQE